MLFFENFCWRYEVIPYIISIGITEVLQALQTFSDTDLSKVQEYLNSLILDSNSFETILSNKKFQNGVFCPHCNSIHIKKNGHKGTIHRFLCKDCGKTFTSRNNTITFSSKKSYHVQDFRIIHFLQLFQDILHVYRKAFAFQK